MAEQPHGCGNVPVPNQATHRALGLWLPLVLFPLLSLALNHHYLRAGFALDDTLLLTALRRDPPVHSRWRGIWGANLGEAWDIAEQWWWRDPETAAAFFRPLPSLVIEESVRRFGHNAFPLHLLSILLHGLVAFTVFRLFARITGKPWLGFLAGLVYVACEDHTLTVGWISASTDIYCVLFINLALLVHLRLRESGRGRDLAGSLFCLALAFACKETAVMAPVAILLLDLLLTRSEGHRLASALRRSWPALAMLAVYLVAYKALELGTMRTLLYADPLSQPLAYLRNAVTTLPIMFAAALTLIPPTIGMFEPNTVVPHAVFGAVVWLLFLWGLWPHRRGPAVQWASLLFVLALIPQVATEPSQRLLYFPYVSMSYLLVVLVCSVAPLRRRLGVSGVGSVATSATRWPTRAWGWYVLLGVFLPGVVLAGLFPRMFSAGLKKPERQVLTGLDAVRDHLQRHPGGTVVITNTSGPMVMLYVASIYEMHLDRTVPVRLLSSCNGVLSLVRTGPRSLVVRTDRPGWVNNILARATRVEPLLTDGRVYHQPPFDATPLELTPDHRDVLRVRFDFQAPLDDPDLLFLMWNGEALVPLDVAALPIGEIVPLADTSDVWKSVT